MDYVDFIVHVFSQEKRAFYGLERLRKTATSLSIADLDAEVSARITAARARSPKKAVAAKRTASKKAAPVKAAAKKAAVKAPAKKSVKKAAAKPSAKTAKK
jgi:ribosome-associated protein